MLLKCAPWPCSRLPSQCTVTLLQALRLPQILSVLPTLTARWCIAMLQGLAQLLTSVEPCDHAAGAQPACTAGKPVHAAAGAEAAAHFDYWQRSGLDDLNRRQDLWPPSLRIARAIAAVEYVQVGLADAHFSIM